MQIRQIINLVKLVSANSQFNTWLNNFWHTTPTLEGDITRKKAANRDFIDVRNRFLAFKNNKPFIHCISNVNNVLPDNAEDLDVVIPVYNLPEYSKNCRKTTGSWWNYYRDKPNNPPVANYNADPITNSASFKYKIIITGNEKTIKIHFK